MLKTTCRSKLIVCAALAVTSVLAAGCASEDDADVLPEEGALAPSSSLGADLKADHLSIPFTTFTDDIGTRGGAPTRKVFTSQSGYRAYFGHNAPSAVDFSRDWVVFYAAGTQSTGGYRASIAYLGKSLSGRTLYVDTHFERPGPDCIVTQAFTKPYVLARFRRPTPPPIFVSYFHSTSVRSCAPPVTGCEVIRCAAGYLCVEDSSGMGSCKPNAPFCGGIAGIPCPGQGECQDDPTDSCDPNNGGADCGGRCACNVINRCPPNMVMNQDPAVCACVPVAPQCNVDRDCELQDNYCEGCACDSVPVGTPPATCATPPVQCFRQPCGGMVPKCDAGRCTAVFAQPGVACGANTCGAGQVCCNASCGICTDPGMACIQIACN